MQDILNVIFHHFPSDLHLLSCRCNFRPDQCLSLDDSCPELDSNVDTPPLMLHGNRAACQDGWPFGSLPAYLHKTAWWFSFNLAYIPYAVRISPLQCGGVGLFRRTYGFFRDLDVRLEGGSLETVRGKFRKTILGPGLEGDLCWPDVAEAAAETFSKAR